MSRKSSQMQNKVWEKRILGIDPGYDRVGFAILDKKDSGKDDLIFSECFNTSPKDDFYSRLLEIGYETIRIIEKYKPDEMAIENLFITKNQKTAMHVSEVRGVLIYESKKRNIPISEYSPVQIKSSVTGDGRSDKERIIKMVTILTNIDKKNALDDEYDAIAIALTHSANMRVAKIKQQ